MTMVIKRLDQNDVAAADGIFRAAFSKFLGIPEPQAFTGDAAIIATRWRANPDAALGAYDDGTLIGSSFATRWGGFGFLGPVSVCPDLWDKGVAKRLVEATVAMLDDWQVAQSALFTFPESAKHIALYQKFGFWPQYLTPVMSKAVQRAGRAAEWSRFSALSPPAQSACLAECAGITDRALSGLDVSPEVRNVAAQRLGETVLIHDDGGLAGFAICHIGKGSEAGTGSTFVKFGAVRPGANAPKLFDRLLDACEAMAAKTACKEIVAGVNAARHHAYRQMIDRGFRAFLEGVAMLRPNHAGYNRADCFVIDDLR